MLLTIVLIAAIVLLGLLLAVGSYADKLWKSVQELRATNAALVEDKRNLEKYIKDRERQHHNNLEGVAKIYRSLVSDLRGKVTSLAGQIDDLHALSLPNYVPSTAPEPVDAMTALDHAMDAIRPAKPQRDARGRFLKAVK